MKPATIAVSGLLILSLSGCYGYHAGPVVRGSAIGAGVGALSGAIVGYPLEGALLGAGAGALVGAAQKRGGYYGHHRRGGHYGHRRYRGHHGHRRHHYRGY